MRNRSDFDEFITVIELELSFSKLIQLPLLYLSNVLTASIIYPPI